MPPVEHPQARAGLLATQGVGTQSAEGSVAGDGDCAESGEFNLRTRAGTSLVTVTPGSSAVGDRAGTPHRLAQRIGQKSPSAREEDTIRFAAW